MHKYIYIVDYWLPFPSSEYGGLQIFIAQDDNEIVSFLMNDIEEYYKERYPDYEELIKKTVTTAKKFPLSGEFNFALVETFIT